MALKEAFNRDFWLDERGWFALALDGDKQPVDVAGVQHRATACGPASSTRTRPPIVAKHLLSDDLFTGWGVRTLAASMGGYNPIS